MFVVSASLDYHLSFPKVRSAIIAVHTYISSIFGRIKNLGIIKPGRRKIVEMTTRIILPSLFS